MKIILVAFCLLQVNLVLSQTVFRGVVLDKATNTPVPNAKVGITNQGVGEVTDKDGKFVYRKYNKVLSNQNMLMVSAPGYKTLTNPVKDVRALMNNRGAIYLEKKDSKLTKNKNKIKNIQVFWDASKTNGYRNFEKERNFLINYIRDNIIDQITFTVFNSEILISKTLKVSATLEKDLTTLLDKINYDGVSDYDLLTIENVDEVILVAANKGVFGTFDIKQSIPVHVVRTNQNKEDLQYFKKLCAYTSGNYFTPQIAFSENNTISNLTIKTGIVSANGKAIQNASVIKLGSLKEYITDSEGKFKVPAETGDVLIIRHLGMFPKNIEVTENTDYIVSLVPKTEVLEEVQLSKKINKPNYNFNEEKQLDVVEGRTLPIRSIYKNDFNPNALNISGLINGRLGIVSGNVNGRIVTSVKGKCARFFVDGVETAPEAIIVSTIEHISVYHAYGSIVPCSARIIITTRYHPDIIDQKFNSLGIERLTNNNYDENIPTLNTMDSNSKYFQENTIKGTVKANGAFLQGAGVLLIGSLKEVETNNYGQFSINATEGDILEIKHLGMYPKTVVVSGKEELNIELFPKTEVLGEVELSQKVDKEVITEYDNFDAERNIEVVNGIKYNVQQVIMKNDLNKSGFDIYETILKTNSRLSRKGDIFIYTRGGVTPELSELKLKTVVDGKDTPAYFVNPLLVERVSLYLKSGKGNSKIFITTRNHPDLQKQYLAENGIKVNDQEFNEAISSLVQSTNNYFLEREIRGVVKVNNLPLQGVSILKQGDLKEVFTDINGAFKINVTDGDILKIKHLGMYPKTVIIEEKDFYEIILLTKAEILDEVALANEKKEEKTTTTTAFGDKDRKSVGYQVDDKLSEYVSATDLSFTQVAQKLPGVVVDPASKKLFFQRSFGAIEKSEIIIIVDGTPISQNTLNSINPQTITNITALKGLAATNKYGSQAFGGVLSITTLANTGGSVAGQPQNLKLKNNIYNEDLPELSFETIKTEYIDEITKERSINIKLENYRKLKSSYRNKVDFYVDMALYFQQLDAGAALEVRNDFALLAQNNVKALRVLAYLNESANQNIQAQKIYELILDKDPGNPQSYRDLALIFQENGEYNKALELYINMLSNNILGVDFSNLYTTLGNELQRLVELYKNNIDYNRLPNDWLAVGFNIDVRMTLAWSDANAPFEFQFVNPDRKFYNWNSKENSENSFRIPAEEFIVDDALSGKWLVNIRYTGFEDEVSVPPYLKYTIYKDYGTTKEEKVIKLVRLDTQIDKVTLDSFVY